MLRAAQKILTRLPLQTLFHMYGFSVEKNQNKIYKSISENKLEGTS